MKKILFLVMTVLLVSGCGEKEIDPMITLCDEVESIANNYLNKSIETSNFIDQINNLNDRCTTDDYLCSEMRNFKNLNDNLKEEILQAHATQLKVNCQMIRDKK